MQTCRKVLCAGPVEPGELFGAAALEALERAARARQTRPELFGLHVSVSAPSRPRGPLAVPQRRSQPPDYPGGLRRSKWPDQQPVEGPVGPVVGWFSQQQLSYWAACTSDPLGQDALAHDWPQSPLYAFPPLPLILPTLQRVLLRGHRLLLVAPFWPGRLRFPLLCRLCCSSPWRLPCRKDLLSQLAVEFGSQTPVPSSSGLGRCRARSTADPLAVPPQWWSLSFHPEGLCGCYFFPA